MFHSAPLLEEHDHRNGGYQHTHGERNPGQGHCSSRLGGRRASLVLRCRSAGAEQRCSRIDLFVSVVDGSLQRLRQYRYRHMSYYLPKRHRAGPSVGPARLVEHNDRETR